MTTSEKKNKNKSGLKKFLVFFGIFVLISSIPAIVYVAYPRHDRETIGYAFPSEAPMAGTSTAVEQETSDYRFEMTPETPPLKTGEQRLKLSAFQGNKPLDQAPEVAVTMPMGNHTMTAPAELEPSTIPGQYTVKTNFSMGGEWHLEIKPQPDSEPVVLVFQVEE